VADPPPLISVNTWTVQLHFPDELKAYCILQVYFILIKAGNLRSQLSQGPQGHIYRIT